VLPNDPPADLLTIGELARQTGRRASAIRYYEEIGLLPEPVRLGGQRRYAADTVRRLAVIDTAQRAGLALDEIRKLVTAGVGDDAAAVAQLRELARRKLPQIAARIKRAVAVQQWLEAAAGCECPSFDDCALFDDAESDDAEFDDAESAAPSQRGNSAGDAQRHESAGLGGSGRPTSRLASSSETC
jgi:MerR family transcriptional regulator, redox-sensitive transcriptional activator SoxR